MKAIVIHEFGGPEVMRYEDFPTPTAGEGEVVVEVHAVSVNRTLDLVLRSGEYARPVTLPHIMGVDPSGIVTEVGDGVEDPKAGDRVYVVPWRPVPNTPSESVGVQHLGGYAEFVKVPAEATVPVPDVLEFPAATVAGRHLGAAFQQMRDVAEVKEGEWVLIMGATGGLGSADIQVAKHLGAKVVAAAGADDRVADALQLGADAGVNYRTEDLTARVKELTDGKGVNVVAENIGDPDLFPPAFASICRGGRLVTAGAHGGGKVTLDVAHLFRNQITIKGILGSSRESVVAAMQEAVAMDFKPLIDRIMPLAEAAEAHRSVADRVGSGKIILNPQMPA